MLLANTRRFAQGLPANNALLWGARGMGKSSLVKAVHGALEPEFAQLKIVEVQREDLASIDRCLAMLRGAPQRFVLFCDDLSFGHDDAHYKSLKAVLDGGIEGRPENVVLYATSNRRHLLPESMDDNSGSRLVGEELHRPRINRGWSSYGSLFARDLGNLGEETLTADKKKPFSLAKANALHSTLGECSNGRPGL